MKRIYTAVMVLLMLTGCAASNTDIEEESTITVQSEEEFAAEIETEVTVMESEVETESETEPVTTLEEPNVTEISFFNDEAENFYNIIMNDTSWRKGEITGAAIIDLDGDGEPEFLASKMYDYVDAYSFGEDKLEYVYSFEWESDTMPRYIGDDGKVMWWGRFIESEDDSPNYDVEETYGLCEFTDNGIELVEKLFYGWERNDNELDVYEAEWFGPDNYYEVDRFEEYSKLDGVPPFSYYGWYMKKAEWEEEHLTNEGNFTLSVNESFWEAESDIDNDIKTLVNAYTNGEIDVLTRDGFFGEVNAFKPVIYLYPEEITNVRIGLELDGLLVCSYPEYDGGWNVVAKPDGTIYNKKDGNIYNYLFWEASLNAEWDMSSGFVIKGSDTVDFLREKLSFIGLNEKEYNEFIVYWLPLMQNNEYNLITFQTEAYENIAGLNITPEPDSVLRVFMTFKALDEYKEIPEQELEVFERNGFTVIEWGGCEMK